MTKTKSAKADTPLAKIQAAAEEYGLRSFDNYSQVRSVAEQIRDGLCNYLDDSQQCVFLVPPQGAFGKQNYGSAAFSVSGKGFLPLEPIAFGLAIQVSTLGDYMRLVVQCRKEGDHIYLQLDQDVSFDFKLPFNDDDLQEAYQGIYKHLLGWFEGRVSQYDDGNYGGTDIGFDIQRSDDT